MGAGVASRWISGGRPGRGGFGVDVVSVAERRRPCGCVLSPPRIAGTRAVGVRGSTDGTTESARAVAFWGRMAPRVGQHFVRTPSGQGVTSLAARGRLGREGRSSGGWTGHVGSGAGGAG